MKCEKCLKDNGELVHIAAKTVTAYLCVNCHTDWGQLFREQAVYRHYAMAVNKERFASDAVAAAAAIMDQLRYLEEMCSMALSWLGRNDES